MKWAKITKASLGRIRQRQLRRAIAGDVDDPAFSSNFNLPFNDDWDVSEPDIDITSGDTATFSNIDDLINDLNDTGDRM